MVSCRLAHRIGEFARIVHANGGDHRLVVDVLAELDILLEERSDTRRERLQCRPLLHFGGEGANGGAEKSFLIRYADDLSPLNALHQHLNVAVGHANGLHDVGDGADLEDVFRPRFVY